MVWAGISANRRTQLYIVNGNLNAQRYVNEILQPIVVPFLNHLGANAIYQDDNARPHRGAVANNFIRQNNIWRMDWPANSPDLNPIEHIWDEFGRRLYRRNPPVNLGQLQYRLVQEWNNIPQNIIRRCIQSMRARCNACIKARGGHTRY